MTLRDLQYVVAVADFGHFGRAAEACHVSQPTLSGQLRKLEDALGLTLFERGRRGARLTRAGEAIVAEARRTLASAARIRALAAAAQDPLAGEFTLGMIPTIAPYLIPRFVTHLGEALPDLDVIYREDVTDRLNADLLAGNLDAAILATPPVDDALEAVDLYDEPFALVTPEGTPAPARLSDVASEELLLLTEGHCFRDQALAVCRPVEGAPARALRATSLETLLNLVVGRQGVTLVPALAVPDMGRMPLRVSWLDAEDASRRVSLTFRKSLPRRELVARLAGLIRADLPDTVQVCKPSGLPD